MPEAENIEGKKKSNAGRPPMYASPGELQKKVDEYFDSIKGEYNTDTGNYTILPQNATVTGLSLYLGFNSRQSMFDYEAKPEFIDIIKRARATVEMGYENHLFSKTPAGAIFALKNMGWTDRREVTGADGAPLIPITGIEVSL